MTTQNLPEAKRAWLIAEMIEELNELLWNHYQEDFITFLLEEEPPYYQSLLSGPK
jgi:DNA polymerase IIIc chi subunit